MSKSTFHLIKHLQDNTYLEWWFETINNLKNKGLITINKKHKFCIGWKSKPSNKNRVSHLAGIKTIEEFRKYI